MNCKLIKQVVKKGEKVYINFYLLFENGAKVAISPKFFNDDVNTFKELNTLATLEK